MKSSKRHWDRIFKDTEDQKLGWYEDDVAPTLSLLKKIPIRKKVFISGVGTSLLIDQLLAEGTSLILNDISHTALDKVKIRHKEQEHEITFLCQDVSMPIQHKTASADVWIDRAVLHFLTDEDDIKGYFNNLNNILKAGGYAIFAEFSKDGATECAGLTLHRYSVEELSEKLGNTFELIESFNHTYFNPNGETRPYIYALYKKN